MSQEQIRAAVLRASSMEDLFSQLADILGGDEPKNTSKQETKDEFDAALEKLIAAKGRNVASQLAHFYKHQETLCETMQYAAREALDRKSAAAAKLYLHLEEYVQQSNRYIFAVCREADVNPEHLGFNDEKTYYAQLQVKTLTELHDMIAVIAEK